MYELWKGLLTVIICIKMRDDDDDDVFPGLKQSNFNTK